MSELLARAELAVDVPDAAVRLLGCTVESDTPDGPVTCRWSHAACHARCRG